MTDLNNSSKSTRNACLQKSSLSGILILSLVIGNCLTLKCFASSHKVHSGAQRYDDVIIIRHADGTIESRDARAPSVTWDDGSTGSHPHHPTRTSHGGKSAAKATSSAKSKGIAHAASSNKAFHKHQHSASSHASAYRGGDDVEIIRNSDGSVEARDAH